MRCFLLVVALAAGLGACAKPDVDVPFVAHGGGGVTSDFGLARSYASIRTLRLADGPDEVHHMVVGRAELSLH